MAPASNIPGRQTTAQGKKDGPFRFDLLPAELQLMVWEFAVVPNGIHHFRLEFPELPDDESEDDVDHDQELVPQPLSLKAVDDPSIWRTRRTLSQTCFNSRHVVQALGPSHEFWTTPVPKQKRRGGQQKQREICRIFESQDLLFFRPSGAYFEPELLSAAKNRLRFRGVTKVALDISPGEKKAWVLKPFECLCPQQTHHDLHHCPRSLSDFLAIFENIECFYFVLNLSKCCFKKPRGMKKTAWIKMPAPVVLEKALANFAKIANAANLDMFFDTCKSYYEVCKKDTTRLQEHDRIWELIEGLQSWWSHRALDETSQTVQQNFQKTQFKLLVCRGQKQKAS